jgi:hypothetical protein
MGPNRSSNGVFTDVSHVRGKLKHRSRVFLSLSNKLSYVSSCLLLLTLAPCSLSRKTSFSEQILSVVNPTRYLVPWT